MVINMKYVFVTDCINAASGEDINEMVDLQINKSISNKNFIEKIAKGLGIDSHVMEILGYDTKKFFSEDWALNCARSFYQGIPCVYVQHSRIEYIYVSKEDAHKVLDTEYSLARHSIISDLSDALYDLMENEKPSTERDYYKLAELFYKQNEKVLTQNRIPLSSLATHSCNYSKAFSIFDKRNFVNKEVVDISEEMSI